MAAEDIPETGPPAIPETYEGDFLQNKKHGIGKMTYMNGETYYGNFKVFFKITINIENNNKIN